MRTLCLFVALLFACVPVFAKDVSSSAAKKFEKRLQILLRGRRAEAIHDLIEEIAELDNKRVAILIPPAATLLPSAANYQAGVEALSSLQDEEAVEVITKLLAKKKGDFRQKVLILEAFGRRADDVTLQAIVAQLPSKISHVRVAAVRAARARKAAAVVPGLLDVLEATWEARDRTFIETQLALVDITGQRFESVEDWRKWWEPVKDSFDPAEVGEQEGLTVVEVKKTEDSVEFFGQEIFSRNLIFVIDVSGSMLMFDSAGYSGDAPERDRQRLRRAQEQLTQALRKLPRGTLFNIVAFSDKIVNWQKRMQPASRGTIASAVKFVTDFKAIGATHTDEALQKAFEDLSVDTIILLSDGAPMKRTAREAEPLIEKILTWFRDTNSSRKVRVDTFGFEGRGEWPAKGGPRPQPPTPEQLELFVEFLKSLSEDSGGTYQAIE